MKYIFSIVSVFAVGFFLMLGGCRAEDPAVLEESMQIEQNTKVSISVVGEEDTPEENVTGATTEGEITTETMPEGGETD